LLPWKGSVPHGTVDSNSTLSTKFTFYKKS